MPLDNIIGLSFRINEPGDWPEKTVRLAEICLDYWRKEKRYDLLVEGVIQNVGQAARLCAAFGLARPSESVRLLQLTRTFETHKRRRAAESEWDPPLGPGMTREDAFRNLEARVPTRIDGARVIVTDALTEDEVYQTSLVHLA